MIIFFALTGLLLLGGGGWFIFDGLPYLVLERGFTQVIVGTVMACAGVVLLGLSRVLAELKRVRTTLSNAVMAVSVASLAGKGGAGRPVDALADAAGPAAGMPQVGENLAPVTAGAIAGALLTTAGTSAADYAGGDAEAPRTAAIDASAIEPDLLAASSRPNGAGEVAMPDKVDAFAQPAVEPGAFDDIDEDSVAAERNKDIWSNASVEQPIDPDAIDGAPAIDANDPFSQAVSDAIAADSAPLAALEPAPDLDADDAGDRLAAAAGGGDPPGRIEPRFDWPTLESERDLNRGDTFFPSAAASLPSAAPSSDEFGPLRETLSGRLHEASPDAADDEPASIAAADSRIETERREPWFGPLETPADEDRPTSGEPISTTPAMSADLTPPPWPPLTRTSGSVDAAFDLDPAKPEIGADEEIGEAAAPSVDAPPPRSDAGEPEPDLPVVPAEPAPPAASNEGVVGAYQVGDAHFTIFADGSIQARTPDGDYKFASMEELKTYLASERDRLGA